MHVDRAGRVNVGGTRLGWVIRCHRRWEWAVEGTGQRSPVRYPTRRAALDALLHHPHRPGALVAAHLGAAH